MKRTLISQTPEHIQKQVTIQGWINTIRDHGKITFLDIRDRSGIVQVVTQKDSKLTPEDVVEITGTVTKRPESMVNHDIETGAIEIQSESLTVLNPSQPLPFPIDTDGHNINEEVRLKYRYLDLRRPRLQRNIKLRSQYVQAAREFLFNQDFTEIETPMLTKSTPEGSRDFVVPSRLQPGKFFALPQSPQQYKQLLMTAGFEKYFQIARCLRDEDPRADRGFEHTQIDLELSFVNREQVMKVVEDMTVYALEKIGAKIAKKPFPIITYKQAMEKYGADKFDLRTEEEKKQGLLSFAWVIDFPFFEKTTDGDWTFTHNPFSQPIPEHEEWLLNKQNIDQILTTQYDLVCNGFEVSGGSIRSHNPKLLKSVFEIMGYSESQIQEKFGHMLTALSYGTPPHGGCAQGFERLLMAHLGEEYIREVQAFPQTGRGRTSVMDAPDLLSPEQLAELGLNPGSTIDASLPVFDQICQKLDNLNIKYQVQEHEPVLTSAEAAKVRGTSEDQGAKALLMLADKQPIMVVLPGSKKADTKSLKQTYNFKDLEMAPREFVEKTTNVQIGGVPPFGSLFNMPTYLDESLGQNQQISFNAGDRAKSITISYQDYLRSEQPTLGAFSK